MKTLPTWHWKY